MSRAIHPNRERRSCCLCPSILFCSFGASLALKDPLQSVVITVMLKPLGARDKQRVPLPLLMPASNT
jgi:hypothetical protein